MTTAVTEQVALQAAQWFYLLRSGEATARQREQCFEWRAADPSHELAWQRAERISASFEQLPGALALPLLNRNHGDGARRRAAKGLAVLLVAGPAGWVAGRSAPAREWLAEYRTGTGERRTLQLSDGTRVELNTTSAIDVAYGEAQRVVLLRAGEVMITTAPDVTGAHRPFLVEALHGRLRALGTRFAVRQEAEGTRLTVFAGAVEARPRGAHQVPVVLRAGQQAYFSSDRVDGPIPASPYADWWTRGILHAEDMRLADFADELARYRPGLLRCDPAVAELRISGVFQLRDTEPVIRSLPQALPVQVVYRTRYWVTLAAPGRVSDRR